MKPGNFWERFLQTAIITSRISSSVILRWKKKSHKSDSQNNSTHWFCHYSQKDGSAHLTSHLQRAPAVGKHNPFTWTYQTPRCTTRTPPMHNTFNTQHDWNHILSTWPRLWNITTFPISALQNPAVTQMILLPSSCKNIKLQGVESIGSGTNGNDIINMHHVLCFWLSQLIILMTIL